MLRQIARLARRVPSMGPRALAVSVYADGGGNLVAAREAGFEGVACIDDAARALEVYCALWDATRRPWLRPWCDGLLDFVLGMQDGDGRWVNFILDWDGSRNREGRTSRPGGHFWQARALLALARAAPVLDDARIAGAVQRALPHMEVDAVPADVRALHITTALELIGHAERRDHAHLTRLIGAWSDEVAACRHDGMLMNFLEERPRPHLWGHIQEGVLAQAGQLLERGELIAVARRSAGRVFTAVIGTGFEQDVVQPYDVASCVESLTRLAGVTGDDEHVALADQARQWFGGRNSAGRPVYDREGGRVADGIDAGVLNSGSGAESNIVAASALWEDTVALARSLSVAPPAA